MNQSNKQRASRPDPTIAHAGRRASWFAGVSLVLILLTVLVIYRPAMHGEKLWDDDDYLTQPQLQSGVGLYRIWFEPSATAQYYPLVHTVFWIEHKLWGDAYLGYHLANVLWHSLAVLLLYAVLKKLEIPGALLAAGIFALHPVMVESVAWMTEQKNTLSAVFYLGATLLYLDFDESHRRSHYVLAILLFSLALFAKTATVTWPMAMLVVLWWQRGTLSWRREVRPLVPFFAIGIVAGLVTMYVEHYFVGAHGADFELTVVQRFLLAGRDIWFYVGKLLWPANLCFTYSRWTIEPTEWWQWVFSIAALTTTFVLWKARKRSRALLAGWLFFCLTLAPVLGFINVFMFRFTYVADHLQYLASLGIIVLFSSAIAIALARVPVGIRLIGGVLCIGLLSTLAILSFMQSEIYAEKVSLYTDTLAHNPDCWMVHNNLGLELERLGNRQSAIEHYHLALHIKPDGAQIHNNLGSALLNMGDYQSAIAEFREAIRYQPDYFAAQYNLGNALAAAGRLPDAIEAFQAALALQPKSTIALENVGVVLIQLNRMEDAVGVLQKAAELDPDNPSILHKLSVALTGANKQQEAIEKLQAALAQKPDYLPALNDLWDTLVRLGRFEEAIEICRAALKVNPDLAPCYAKLSQALARLNRQKEAIESAEKGIEISRRTGQDAVADEIEGWLKHYKIELGRDGHSAAPEQSPATTR